MSFTAEDAESAEKNLEMSKTRKVLQNHWKKGKTSFLGNPGEGRGRPGIQDCEEFRIPTPATDPDPGFASISYGRNLFIG